MKRKLTDKQREVLEAVNIGGATLEYWSALGSSAIICAGKRWSPYKHVNLSTVDALVRKKYLGRAKVKRDWRFTTYIITPAGKEALKDE